MQWNAPTNYQNGNRITEPVRSALYDQTLVLQRDFDQHHDLGGLAFSRTWGLASWGSYVAACITFHPGDMVEYIMPSSERCHIVFMKEDADDDLQENANFPWQEISATNVERSTHIVLQEILTMTDGQAAAQTALDQRILYNICCASLILCESQYLYLVNNMLRKLSMFVEGGLEAELDLVGEVQSSGLSTVLCMERLNQISRSRSEHGPSHSTLDLNESCSICEETILWQSSTEAVCMSGHQFGKCWISYH